MKRFALLLALLGAIALLVGLATFMDHASAAPGIGVASVMGNYAFSTSFHDPASGQEGNSAGAFVFDGAGNVTGVYSQGSVCAGCGGQSNVDRAPLTGTYTVNGDGSTTIDICINVSGRQVRSLFQGAFSNKFSNLRFVQTALGTCGGTSGPPLNATSGTAEKG